jgi:hypothetical protein
VTECRSQWPRGLRHELSSPAPTLRSWVRIALRHGCLCVFCVRFFCFYIVWNETASRPNKKVNEDLSLDKPLHVTYKVSKWAYRIWVILLANKRVKKKWQSAPFTPQERGSHFVSFYDSQGYGEGIITQRYSIFFVRVSPIVIHLQLCTPKVVGV